MNFVLISKIVVVFFTAEFTRTREGANVPDPVITTVPLSALAFSRQILLPAPVGSPKVPLTTAESPLIRTYLWSEVGFGLSAT
ncbi:MAG: hypothetical protein V1681_06015, partial [Candidatus Neomarinimicrobiota bacterium]